MTEVQVLQQAELDQLWSDFDAATGRPDGLMTYRYLGTTSRVIDRHHAEGTLGMRADLWGPAGPRAAPLVILYAEVLGALSDSIAMPAPTQFDLSVFDACDGVAEVLCLGEIVHEGRTAIFGKARFVDAADPGRVLAVCRDSEVVVGPAPEGDRPPAPASPDLASRTLPPLWQAYGAEQRADGTFAVPALTGRIGARSGSLHHGTTQVVLEEGALHAATAAVAGQLRLRHWHVTLNARGKDGPFAVTTDVVAASGVAVAVDADLRDESTGRLIASASATYDIVGSAR